MDRPSRPGERAPAPQPRVDEPCRRSRESSARRTRQEGFADTFTAAFTAIYDDVARGFPSPKPRYATFRDGHEEMLIGEAVLESSRTGRWVDVAREPAFAVTR